MGLWNYLVTSQMDPEDDFRQRLRKSVIGVLFFPCCFILAGYCIRGFGWSYRAPTQVATCMSLLLLAITFAISYVIMRRRRYVSDSHVAVVMWVFAILVTMMYFCFVEFDNKSVIFASASMAIMTQMPTLPGYLGFLVCQVLLSDWNQSHIANYPEKMITLPDPRMNASGTVVLSVHLAGTVLLVACVYMFYLQIVESERRGAAQSAANVMTMKVLQRQRKYNTDDVSGILEEFTEAAVVDPALIRLFQEMNDNLERYRPFLPNYLFNETEEEEEEEEHVNGEEEVTIRGGGGSSSSPLPFRNTLHTAGEEEGDEGSGHSSSQSCTDVVKKFKQFGSSRESADSLGGGDLSDDGGVCSSSKYTRGDRGARLNRSRALKRGTSGGSRSFNAARGAQPVTVNLNRRGSLFVGRITFALVDIAVNRLVGEEEVLFMNNDLNQRHGTTSTTTTTISGIVLSIAVAKIYALAKETKASVHSMLGDTVQLTWNATSSVALPETKGALFLIRLAKALLVEELLAHQPDGNNGSSEDREESKDNNGDLPAAASAYSSPPKIRVSGAVCSGKATAHSITSHHQQALLIEAPWLPALEGSFVLAKQNNTHQQLELRPRRNSSSSGEAAGTFKNTLLTSGNNNNNNIAAPPSLLMDEVTMQGSTMEVSSIAVEQVTYCTGHSGGGVARSSNGDTSLSSSGGGGTPSYSFLCHNPVTPSAILQAAITGATTTDVPPPQPVFQSSIDATHVGDNCPQPQQLQSQIRSQSPPPPPPSSGRSRLLLYQLLDEKVRGGDDAEWMYQLQQGEEQTVEESKLATFQLQAVKAIRACKYADGLSCLESAAETWASVSAKSNAVSAATTPMSGQQQTVRSFTTPPTTPTKAPPPIASASSSSFFSEALMERCQAGMMELPPNPRK